MRALCPKLTSPHPTRPDTSAQEFDHRQPKYLNVLEAAFKLDEDEFVVLSGGSFIPVVIFGNAWGNFSLSLLVSRGEMSAKVQKILRF